MVFFGLPASLISALPRPETQTITVIGEGRVSRTPDIATVRIGAEAYAAAVDEALAESRMTIESIYDALIDLGIQSSDMQTSNYSFNFERSSQTDFGSSRSLQSSRTMYRVNNILTVTIRDLGNTGDIIDAAVFAGANQMWGVDFDVDDSQSIYKIATEKAVVDANKRAGHLASLSGVAVGELLRVSEVIDSGTNSPLRSEVNQDINPGMINFSVKIQAVFELLNPKNR